jgi:hypothetical protein
MIAPLAFPDIQVSVERLLAWVRSHRTHLRVSWFTSRANYGAAFWASIWWCCINKVRSDRFSYCLAFGGMDFEENAAISVDNQCLSRM